jgi:hypothetical protein
LLRRAAEGPANNANDGQQFSKEILHAVFQIDIRFGNFPGNEFGRFAVRKKKII